MRKNKFQEFVIISGGAICSRHTVLVENVTEIFNQIYFVNRCEVVDKTKDKNHSNDDCLCYLT